MHEIKCPHCSKAFKIDEAGYSDILKQVRDSDFEKQLHERLELAEKDKTNAIELAEAKIANEMEKSAKEYLSSGNSEKLISDMQLYVDHITEHLWKENNKLKLMISRV